MSCVEDIARSEYLVLNPLMRAASEVLDQSISLMLDLIPELLAQIVVQLNPVREYSGFSTQRHTLNSSPPW
jgi:hypothetical protein